MIDRRPDKTGIGGCGQRARATRRGASCRATAVGLGTGALSSMITRQEQTPCAPDRAKFHLSKTGLAGPHLPHVCTPLATSSKETVDALQKSTQAVGLQRAPSDGYRSNHRLKAAFVYGNVNPRPVANILQPQLFKGSAPWNEIHWQNETFGRLMLILLAETEAGIGIPGFVSDLDAYTSHVKGPHPIPTGDAADFNFAQHVWLDG